LDILAVRTLHDTAIEKSAWKRGHPARMRAGRPRSQGKHEATFSKQQENPRHMSKKKADFGAFC